MKDLINDNDFIRLEKEYSFLRRARNLSQSCDGALENLTYIIVDLETTGLNTANDEIIEIGAIKMENGELKDIFNKLVKPEFPISPNITELTGISQEMVASELSIKPVLTSFRDFIAENPLVAHNADFDINFLKSNFRKHLNIDMINPYLCTLMMSRDILPNLDNHKLHTIAKYFGIEVANRHRAIGDAEVTYQVWLKFLDKLKERKILTKAELETYAESLKRTKPQAVSF